MNTVDKIDMFANLKTFQSYKSFSLFNLKGKKLSSSTKSWLDHIKNSRDSWE